MKESHIHERGIVSERREFLAAAATSLLLLPVNSSSEGVAQWNQRKARDLQTLHRRR